MASRGSNPKERERERVFTTDWITRARPSGRSPRGLCVVEGSKEGRERERESAEEGRKEENNQIIEREPLGGTCPLSVA